MKEQHATNYRAEENRRGGVADSGISLDYHGLCKNPADARMAAQGEHNPARKSIRYGVLGLGRAGLNIHIGQLLERDDAAIVAVADKEPSRREEVAELLRCRAYEDRNALLGNDDIDVVIVATPSDQHTPDVLAALEAGKHVIVEKPLALTVRDGQRMIQAAQTRRRRLFVHHQHRFGPVFRHMEGVVQSGVLGRIFLIRVHVSTFHRRNDWQTLKKYGGGELNNTGSHYIDQVLQLMGAPVTEAMGDLRRVVSAGDADDHLKALLRSSNGCVADVEISRAEAIAMPVPLWTVCGDCGTLTYDGTTFTLKWFDPRHAPDLRPIDGPALNREYSNGDVLPWQTQLTPLPIHVEETFYDNVIGVLHRNEPQRVTPESACEVLRVSEMIRLSAHGAVGS